MSNKEEKQVVENEGVGTEIEEGFNPNLFQLKKPIDRMGDKVHSLILDFESLSLGDLLEADKEFTKMVGEQVASTTPVKAFNTAYQMAVAARAAGIPVQFFASLSARDATSIGLRVQSFLLGGE